MKFGHFDDVKKEYVISNPRTPYPWINYLGTQEFFSLISNTAGGYSFYKDARLRRITRYRYNNVPIDMGGRYFYIKDGETIWNPGWSPVKTELDAYECRHGMGYTIITGKKNGLKAEATFFVPQNYNGEVQQVVLTNESNEEKTFSFFSFAEWCQESVIYESPPSGGISRMLSGQVLPNRIDHLDGYRIRLFDFTRYGCRRLVGVDWPREGLVFDLVAQ